MILLDVLLKSIRTYDLYSFLPNSSAIVDLPILLAPSIKSAFVPFDFCFHSKNSLYIFSFDFHISPLYMTVLIYLSIMRKVILCKICNYAQGINSKIISLDTIFYYSYNFIRNYS